MGHSVRQINCDGGGEYTAGETAKHLGKFESVCQEAKIELQFTSPCTPSQNGVSERLNRTIIKGVRTMFNDSALSHRLWSFAAEHLFMSGTDCITQQFRILMASPQRPMTWCMVDHLI